MTARRRVLCTRELCVSFALGPAPPDARLETERQNRPWERRTWPFANQTSSVRRGGRGLACRAPACGGAGGDGHSEGRVTGSCQAVLGAVALRRVCYAAACT